MISPRSHRPIDTSHSYLTPHLTTSPLVFLGVLSWCFPGLLAFRPISSPLSSTELHGLVEKQIWSHHFFVDVILVPGLAGYHSKASPHVLQPPVTWTWLTSWLLLLPQRHTLFCLMELCTVPQVCYSALHDITRAAASACIPLPFHCFIKNCLSLESLLFL